MLLKAEAGAFTASWPCTFLCLDLSHTPRLAQNSRTVIPLRGLRLEYLPAMPPHADAPSQSPSKSWKTTPCCALRKGGVPSAHTLVRDTVDCRSDLYSLAEILLEVLSREPIPLRGLAKTPAQRPEEFLSWSGSLDVAAELDPAHERMAGSMRRRDRRSPRNHGNRSQPGPLDTCEGRSS
jgi:hypothetical protein